MSVVGISTCSGFKTGLYISYHMMGMLSGISNRGVFSWNILEFLVILISNIWLLRIEQILHNFEDQKFAKVFNLRQVNIPVTLIIYDNYLDLDGIWACSYTTLNLLIPEAHFSKNGSTCFLWQHPHLLYLTLIHFPETMSHTCHTQCHTHVRQYDVILSVS